MATPGEISIANAALTKIGAATISDFTDDSVEGRVIAARYESVRDAELRRHKWRFSIKRVEIAADATAPAFGYGYRYILPSDCLRILGVGDYSPGWDHDDYRDGHDRAMYSLESGYILTDYGPPLKLRYIARVTSTGQFDTAFAEALGSRLAYEIADRISGTGSRKQEAWADYRQAIAEAIQANALEVPPETYPDDSWIMARR